MHHTETSLWICLSLSFILFSFFYQDGKISHSDKAAFFYCCSRNPFTQRCSTVSATRSHVDPSAQNCTICKHITPNLHCRISPLKVQHKKRRRKKKEEKKQNTVSESPLMNSFPTALNSEEKQDKSIHSGTTWNGRYCSVNLSCALF